MTFLFTDAAFTLEDAWLGTVYLVVAGHVRIVGARQIRSSRKLTLLLHS